MYTILRWYFLPVAGLIYSVSDPSRDPRMKDDPCRR